MSAMNTTKQRITIGLLIVVLAVYQAPNLALLAYKAGMPLVDTDLLGVEVKVRNGWYPAVSSESLLGKATLPRAGPPLVAFHRPSLIWPWQTDVFAVMSYRKPIDTAAIESAKEMPWGRTVLVKASPPENPKRLFAVPDLGVGLLLEDQSVLDDIVTLKSATKNSKLQ